MIVVLIFLISLFQKYSLGGRLVQRMKRAEKLEASSQKALDELIAGTGGKILQSL